MFKWITVGSGLLISFNVAQALTPLTQSTTPVQITASVDYMLANINSASLDVPAPVTTGIPAMLSAPANFGQDGVIPAGQSPQPFSLYSNAGTPIYIQATNTSGAANVTTSPTTPMLSGSATNTTEIKYAINYTPCGGAAVINLANQCGNSSTGLQGGCAIPSSNSSFATCSTSNGSISYTYDIPKTVNADDYSGKTTLTYRVGA